MKKVKLIKQHDEKDCGAACLSMILGYYGKKLPLATVREEIKVDQDGANIYGLLDGAGKNGLTGNAFEGKPEDVWEAIENGEAVLPAIVRIVNRNGYEHYIVVTGIKGTKMYICDPDEGKRKMSAQEFSQCFLGQIILFEKTVDFKKENRRKSSLLRFTDMIFHQKKLLASIGILSMFVTTISLLGTFLFQFLIDGVIGDLSNKNLLDEAIDTLSVVITALAILYLFKFAVQYLRGKLLTKMSRNIDLPLMLGYYDHVTELPMNFFDTRKTGEIISRFNDASKLRDAISGVTLTLMMDVILVTVCGIVLHRESPVLFVIATVIFAVYVIISMLYMKPVDKFNRELMEQNAQFNSYLKETIDGMETVKVLQAENTVITKTHDLFNKVLNRNISGSMMELTKESLIEFVTSVGTLVLLWAGTLEVIKGNMTVGSLVTFYSLLNYFLSPIQNLVELQGTLQSALVAADRLNDILDLSPEASGDQDINEIHEIALEDVSFRYGNRDLILKNLSLSAHKGEQIALTGESGCGKSTVTKLLMGLYDPEKGSVKINGKDVKEYSLKAVRDRIAYVPQSTFFFADTIKANLFLGLEENKIPTEEELEKVLDLCCCDFIKRLPFGIESMLDENGANLSGGQRQRLAIARAILRKPELLILDEATSALDNITEYRIQSALRKLCSNMIVVTIAHRLSTVKSCNQILVMDQGLIVEKGTHKSLLEMDNKYAVLWKRQNENCSAA